VEDLVTLGLTITRSPLTGLDLVRVVAPVALHGSGGIPHPLAACSTAGAQLVHEHLSATPALDVVVGRGDIAPGQPGDKRGKLLVVAGCERLALRLAVVGQHDEPVRPRCYLGHQLEQP
jgi:hypothetical protein